MSSKWRWAGTEVPIIGSDSFKFIEISVSSSSINVQSQSHSNFIAPRADGYASCALVGDPSLHLILRIRESLPNSLDLFPLSFSKPFPILGLRINFPCKLSSFAFLFELTPNVYSLCVLSVSGIVFILKLSANFSDYETYPIFPQEDLLQFNLVNYGDIPITSAAATSGCLVVGRNDGSVAFFQLATHHPTAPGFVQELRDDSGIGRLWGLMSRGRMVGAVQDLVITEVQGKKLVYVLHSGGIFRSLKLILSLHILFHLLSGAPFVRLWVGETNSNSSVIPLAIWYRYTSEVGMEAIDVYSLQCSWGKEPILSLEPSMLNVPMEEGSCIDVKLASDRIWILKDSGIDYHVQTSCSTFSLSKLCHMKKWKECVEVWQEEEAHCFALQEEFVADMLFQSSEHPSDDLLSITHSIVTSPKVHDYSDAFVAL
ncbi:hypothetical protein Patl1_14808 [Pistacia atlantica]|uniref:Uncharacterized protein n=1 Tax=Pistacia atlantica TaxID=434234 RepID=A0ACC1AV59_9ROSI|nr:hypothetical protein Patl1_14808 [Pistacia atlantica]